VVLKYVDDEGDLCTLVDASMEDLSSLASGGPWRLQASLEKTSQSKAEPGGSDRSEGLPWQGASVNMGFYMLPFVSRATQSEPWRSALNRGGLERREEFLPLCGGLAKHLDLVPEAATLRPKLEAFLDGSDIGHFGDFLADLLKAWAESASPERVKDAIAIHHDGLRSMVKQTFHALRHEKGKGKGKCMWKGKSKGKGKWGKGHCGLFGGPFGGLFGGAPWESHWGSPWCGSCGSSDDSLGPKATDQGSCGMGAVPQHGHARWMEMLAGLFRQKGFAKGHGSSWWESTAAEAEFAEGAETADAAMPSAPTAASESATSDPLKAALSSAEASATSDPLKAGIWSVEATPPEGAPPTTCEIVESTKPTIAERPAEDDTMRRQIDTLLELGVVVDREVAQELLRAQGGIEQVVAMFAA
jgi:hypothetical protein